jgi:hypothetical protein
VRANVRLTLGGACSSLALVALLAGEPREPRNAYRFPQSPILLVRVVESGSARPLTNAEVTALDAGVSRLTNERGEARIPWPPSRSMRLRVRQVGFRFVERVVDARSAPTDTVTVTLQRVAFALDTVHTDVATHCDASEGAATRQLSLLALQQLRLAAEHYEQFRREFPFRIITERRTASVPRDSGGRSRLVVLEQKEDSERWGDPYRPGEVLRQGGGTFNASLLFVTALADSVFWANHCFVVRGVASLQGQRAIRLDFAAVPGLDSPDWQGTAWIDSSSSVLRRVDFRLTGLKDDDDPTRLEGFTTFRMASPFITVPDSTMAIFWRHRPEQPGNWGKPDMVQLLHTKQLTYRDAQPPPL